jgi:pimeloyl-ACP methyl ester carboxylesterase
MTRTSPEPLTALGIGLEEYDYPYAVRFLPLTNDLQALSMAYMDIPPRTAPSGMTVVLMHGKAFGGYYFHNVIEALVRFTLMNPDRVAHLVLEDPLGLADYRTGIPPQSEETLYQHELHWTDPGTIRGYVKSYFVNADPAVYEPLADVLVRVTLSPDYPRWARAAALTFQMIYQQPVRYEYHQIAPPTLLIVGAEDHVVPLGQYATPAEAARLGDFTALSAAAADDIPRATRVVIPGSGHIPHLEQPSQFLGELLPFLAR